MKNFLVMLSLFVSGFTTAADMNYGNLYNIRLVSDAVQARCFIQDENGFIWVGTNKGLCCYDGYNVQAHYKNGAPENVQIHALSLYGDNCLFLGTETGMMIYDFKHGKYVQSKIGLQCIVRSLLSDGDCLWMGTTDGLYLYDIKNGSVTCVLPDVDVYSVVRLRDRVFAGTRNGLYFRPEGTSGFEPTEGDGADSFIGALYADEASNSLWFGWKGLYRMHVYSGETEMVSDSISAKSLLMDCDGNIVVGTDYGLIAVDPETGVKTVYKHNLHRHNSLSNNVVQAMFRDDNDNVWIGTDYGISLAQRHKLYEYYNVTQFTDGGEGNLFFVMTRDASGNLWMGGNNGVIMNPYDPLGDALWFRMRDVPEHDRIAHNRIRDIYSDRNNNLWVASDGGLQLFDAERSSFEDRAVADPESGDRMYWVYKVLEDREGNFWFSTYNEGVWKVGSSLFGNSSVNECIERYTENDGLSGDFISAMAYNETSNAVYTLANNGGIDIIDCSSGDVGHLDVLGLTGGSFPSAMVSGDDEYLWIGYSHGLIRYDTLEGTSSRILFGNGRHLSVTCMILAEGDIWVCTNEGIWVVSGEGNILGNFNFEDKVFYSACWDLGRRKLFFGDSDGYAAVFPEIVGRRMPSEKLVVSRILVNGQEYISPDGLVSRYVDRLKLESDENDVSVEFADLTFSNARVNCISYRLGGGDIVSLKSGSNRVSLTGLRPGNHYLSFTGDGVTDAGGFDAAGDVSIMIKRPPFASGAAFGIYAFIAICTGLSVYRYYRLKAKLRMARAEKEQTLQRVEEKMRIYTDISHEFKTPLSMILAPASKMLTERHSEKDMKDLQLIHDSAIKINQLLHGMIEADKNELSMELGLTKSRVEVVGFIHTIFSVFEDNQKDKGKEFIFSSSAEKIYCMLDVVKLESIVNNLVSNACKYTSEGDSIIVSITLSSDRASLEIKVSDTGVGIPHEDLPYIFHRFFKSQSNSCGKEGSGIGLFLVKNYVSMHGGTVAVSSEQGEGSTFTVTLPFDAGADDASEDAVCEDGRIGLPTVVIVEDNKAIAEFVRDLLYDSYRCLIAMNGKSGLRLCKEILPDLVITDIMMPVMDGIKMCAELRANVATASIPIIVLTAVEDKKYELFTAKHRIDAFITKPFDSNYIVARVKGLIDKKLEMEKRIRMEMIAEPGSLEAVSADEKLLSRLVDVIEEHISDSDFNVNALCVYLGMSSKSVYRKCVQLLNMTPVEYIRFVRLKKAAFLLEQHNFNVSEVMYMVGFNNHSYFSRCFLKEFGKSPQQYRMEHGVKVS